ncbi:MAG TPA: BTAD domain-containing putative transcriptional regulator [Pseudonocardia sp.]|nr:BTAD domain-containing putative transcriptional regulator [Pseudonocardia sp.]
MSVLECRVLGPTEVEVEGTGVDLGGPLPRRLVTALVAVGGQPVSDERLVEAVWGLAGPRRGPAALHVYVSRLRRALGSGAREALERTGSGYRLRLAPEATDTERFSVGLDEGRRLLAQGRADAAVRVLTDALGLWRGEAFEDLPASEFIESARSQLAELREVAVEERLAARLAAGDAPGAVSELDPAVVASPYRERRWALLILGLYRSGRQGEALAALRRVRTLLTEVQGIGPGPELRELEQRVLSQDPSLQVAEPARPGPPNAAGSQPDGWGRRLSSFLGRDAELATVAAALASRRLVTIAGPAGVGKTRLAVEYLGSQTRGDGPWLAKLADVPPARPGERDGIGRAIADAVGLVEAGEDPAATVTESLADRRGVLVLDNCEHLVDLAGETVIELLEACPDLRVLATSREPLGVDGETVVAVAPLAVLADDGSDGPAVALLLDRVRTVRPGWEPSDRELAAARRVCAALDGLPLALELAAARARVLGLAEIAERLRDRFAVLGPVPKGSLSPHATLRAALGWTVARLPEPDRALLLRLWPFEAGFSLAAAEAVRPTEAPVIESLSSLVNRSVVMADTAACPTRYHLLETWRAYCRESDPDPVETVRVYERWSRDAP